MKNRVTELHRTMHWSEIFHFLAGLAILISVFVVWQTGGFEFWWTAKALYAIGVVLVLFMT